MVADRIGGLLLAFIQFQRILSNLSQVACEAEGEHAEGQPELPAVDSGASAK